MPEVGNAEWADDPKRGPWQHTHPGGAGGTPSDTVQGETAFGVASAPGVATTFSRGDHTHGSPSDPVPPHVAAADPHTAYALDTDLSAHVAAADPHPSYQRETEKGAASGYASLDAGIKVPVAELPDATTTAKGVVELATDGEAIAGVAVQGNDARNANARTPTVHASSHQPGGGDAMAVDAVAATGSLRTLGTGAQQAAVGNHTHPGGSEAFPVGAVFIAVVATNPATLLGYGTWSAFATGRMLVGIDAGQTEFDLVEETGGAKTHTLVEAEMPAHSHTPQRYPTATGGSTSFTVDTSMSGTPAATTLATDVKGGGGAHNNLPPYIVVYMWKRTA